MAARVRKTKIADPPAMAPVPVLAADPSLPAVLPPAYQPRCQMNLFEWMTSLMMLGVAVIVTANPKAVQFGGFYMMAEIGLTAPILGLIYFAVGTGRIAALVANGSSVVYGPAMRVGGAVVGVVIWSQMLYALIVWSLKGGYLSIGVSVYLFLVIGEGISCYRAAADVRPKH